MVEEEAQNDACRNGACKEERMDSDATNDREKASIEKEFEEEGAQANDAAKNSLNIEIVLRKRVKELEGQIAILKEAVVRNLAETENLRKRLEKEKSDAIKYANGKFAKDLLGVADNFDRVMRHIKSFDANKVNDDPILKPIAEGVELCGKELLSVFRKHGIDRVDVSEGTNFDPNYHQAMCEVESEKHNPGSVIDVMQSGYTYNDRLLRPAMVTVAKKNS